MPDIEMSTDEGQVRVYSLLHDGRPLLINLGERGSIQIGSWFGTIRLLEGRYDGDWQLPVIGAVDAPQAVLVRPDGYVAWVGEGGTAGLREAMTAWFGSGAEGTCTAQGNLY